MRQSRSVLVATSQAYATLFDFAVLQRELSSCACARVNGSAGCSRQIVLGVTWHVFPTITIMLLPCRPHIHVSSIHHFTVGKKI